MPTEPGGAVLELDPGLASGTGAHATTAMCLEWLDGCPLCALRVLDYGCGSAILALAALKLGARLACACDILLLAGLLDAQAEEVAHAHRPCFDIEIAARRDGWIALAGHRRAE